MKEKLIGLQGDKAIDTGRSNFAAHTHDFG